MKQWRTERQHARSLRKLMNSVKQNRAKFMFGNIDVLSCIHTAFMLSSAPFSSVVERDCDLKWCEKEGAFIEDTTAYYKDCYYHGYEYGFQKRNVDLDLFQRALDMRKQYAAQSRRLNY